MRLTTRCVLTDDPIEDLPSPIAWASARAAPLEAPSVQVAAATARAFVEVAVVRVLAEALGAPRALPFTVESAMRLVMLDEMESDSWVDLFAALEHCGMSELLALPSDLPSLVRDAMDAAGLAELTDWLEQAGIRDPLAVAPAINALTRAARGLYDLPLHYVRRVSSEPDGATIEFRRLVGTAWPPIRRTRHAGEVPVRAGSLAFWDGDAVAIAVPDWLARWDDRTMTLWLYSGRDVASGQWRFEAWAGGGMDVASAVGTGRRAARSVMTVTDGACVPPPFLLEGSAVMSASDPRMLDPNAQTAIVTRADRANELTAARPIRRRSRGTSVSATGVGPPVADALFQEATPQERPPDGVLCLRVLTGVDLMRYVVLSPGDQVVLGRNAGTASFVLHHHQISRMHTEVTVDTDGAVTVADLGSTNGTHVLGKALPHAQRATLVPGALVGVGPVLMRLEWLTPEARARLDEILDLDKDVDSRDPHTRLLHPTAVGERLPRSLRASFRDGGTAPHAPPLWGILLYVDRLAAIHAQHGERVADRVFRDVARVLQYEVESPGSWARVGYGELLLPCVGVTDAWVAAEGARLASVIAQHPWEAPIERLSASVATSRKDPAEPAQEWLKRLRSELRERKPREGRPTTAG